jgi:hypothetical protein
MAAPGRGRERSQVWRGRFLCLIGCLVRLNQKLGYIRLRFRRVMRKYEISEADARGQPLARLDVNNVGLRQNHK